MKCYQRVVKERYDGYEKLQDINENIYSIINPVGFYGSIKIEKVIYKVLNKLKSTGMGMDKVKILDVGCGSGWITRYFAEFTQNPLNIFGMDLSKHRIEIAKKMSPNINYFQGDIVNMGNIGEKFDIISAFDVFMHLSRKEEINKSIKNIYSNLSDNGIFIWYDAYSKDHFNSPLEVDSWGFNPKQMDCFCEEHGFRLLYETSVNKNILGKVQSIYLYKSLPEYFVRLCEKIFPGSPCNIVKVYIK